MSAALQSESRINPFDAIAKHDLPGARLLVCAFRATQNCSLDSLHTALRALRYAGLSCAKGDGTVSGYLQGFHFRGWDLEDCSDVETLRELAQLFRVAS